MFSNLAKLLPVGKVPTLPDVLNFAMPAKLLFQRCFVQKVELCQITRLSQRMAQKKTVCVLNAGGLFVYGRFQHRGSGLAKQNPPGSWSHRTGTFVFQGMLNRRC